MKNENQQQASEWKQDFEASSRRSLKERWGYSFTHTYKPVLDDAPYRSFETTRDYKSWCEKNLPNWLGYGQKL